MPFPWFYAIIVETKRRFFIKGITFITALFLPLILFSQDTDNENFMNAYVVFADTSYDYFLLHKKMFELSEKLSLEIDTMRRGYDSIKDLICLSEDDEDEIYAGEYYPRRFPGTFLSLEHFIFYNEGDWPGDRTMALVTAITEEKEKADEILSSIEEYSENAFILYTKIYIGCIH